MGRSQRHKVYVQGVAADGKQRAEGVIGNPFAPGADGGPLQGSQVPGPVAVTVQMVLDYIESGGGGGPPAITGIGPEDAMPYTAGVVGRVLVSLTAVGGTPPYTFTAPAVDGLAASVVGSDLVADADPVGVAGGYQVPITVTDAEGQTLTEDLALTLITAPP